MPIMHFHVDEHDVGYQPDADNVATHLTIDGALNDALTRTEDLINALAQLDPADPIRGQQFTSNPVTNATEIDALVAQMKEVLTSISTDENYTADVARRGLLIAVDHGWAVIELIPCSEDVCETYREDWIE
jgi:hypothetical protein